MDSSKIVPTTITTVQRIGREHLFHRNSGRKPLALAMRMPSGSDSQVGCVAAHTLVMAEGVESYTALSDRVKLMRVQTRIAYRSVEAFLLPILPRLAWIAIQRLNTTLCKPGLYSGRHKFCPVASTRRFFSAPCWATSTVRIPITRSADVDSATSRAKP